VLDEFHYVLLNDYEYRPKLLAIRQLARFAVPLTLLTATLPLSLQQEAFRLLDVSSNVRVFREQTVRKNIRYKVDSTYADDNFSINRIAAYVKMQQTGYKKILVYVAHTADVDKLSKKLGV
jgi:superfamily II DNA helicase RecQ